jgi:assimilatory nitrate reductase catalytic subunit
LEYFAVRPLIDGQAFECASKTLPENWSQFISELCPKFKITSSVHGSNSAHYRCLAIHNDELAFAFFASDKPVFAARDWLQQQLGKFVNPLEVLAGRPMAADEDKGPILCACMNVGRKNIANFINENTNATLQTVCEATGAGTGCGSCRIEVQRMINDSKSFIQAAE